MRFLLLADLHIGSIKDITYLYNVITEILERELIFNHTDAVIILGDYFDRLFKVNEEYTSLAINVMSYLIRLCKKTRTKIRIVYGTESHEMSQYKLFNYHFNDPSVDIKLIDTVTSEEIFPNVNVLYLPEEYTTDKFEFYKDYLYSGMKYNYIFGHGIIAEGMSMINHNIIDESKEKKVPIFKSKELSSVSDICAFGHYHVYTDMGDDCYYVGSTFRDSFGEEEAKGYGVIEDNKFKFIENTSAYLYKTYTYEVDSDIYKNMDTLISQLNKIKEIHSDIFSGQRTGKIRMIFKFPDNMDHSFKESIKTLLLENKSISYMIKETLSNSSIKEDDVELEYDFILDNSLAVEDKIHRYINKNYDIELSLDELTSLINDELRIQY
jgi:DNA repair exonuclease SbcCD nuclease subunit